MACMSEHVVEGADPNVLKKHIVPVKIPAHQQQ